MKLAYPGNDKVIMALEMMLAKAREGRASYLIAVMVDDTSAKPMGGWFGSPITEPKAMLHLEYLAGQMEDQLMNRTMEPRDPNVTADCVCYNVPGRPLSFDFLTWLIDAEMTRIREGAPAPLKVCLWYGRDGNSGLEDAKRKQLMAGVVKPAMKLLGAVEDPRVTYGRAKEVFVTKDICAAVRAGEKVPYFSASPEAKERMQKYRGAVTITLRESTRFDHRNSNLDAWYSFGQYLEERGHRVVIVRDTEKAHLTMGLETCPEASIDLDLRCALYEGAAANLFVSNGPQTLALYGDRPWLSFIKIEDDNHPYAPNTPSFWREEFGVEVGGQYPWSKPDQRLIWKPDTYENIVEAWNQLTQENAQCAA